MRVVVAQEQTGNSEPIRQILLGMGLECSATDCVTHTDLPVRLAQNPADLVLVRVGASQDSVLEAIRQAQSLTRSPVMITGASVGPEAIVRYMQGGAREYLEEGSLQVHLENALDRLRQTGDIQPGQQGQVVGVLSATPGSGVTTVAVNLAFAWAENHPHKVALLEMGRGVPDMALCLDLDPRHSVADVHENWPRLDATLLRQSMLAHPDGVQILAYRPETLAVEPLSAQAVRKSVILLRTLYDATILDLGHILGEEQQEALRLCDHIAVVVRLDVPALRHTRRFLRVLTERGLPKDRIRLVANRYGQRGQIAWKKAEEAINSQFAEYLREDSGKMNAALNQGQAVVRASRYSGISRRFFKLVAQLNGRPK